MARAPETIPPEVLLDDAAPPMREIAEALRALVRRARPDALERVRPRWGLLGYDVPVGRRARSFAWIWPQPEHVHLGFDWGIAMDDPYGLLHGRTKRVRWTTWDRLGQLDAATRAKLEWLVREAAEVATLGPDERSLRRLSRADARSADPP
jgi:hypothetical protein